MRAVDPCSSWRVRHSTEAALSQDSDLPQPPVASISRNAALKPDRSKNRTFSPTIDRRRKSLFHTGSTSREHLHSSVRTSPHTGWESQTLLYPNVQPTFSYAHTQSCVHIKTKRRRRFQLGIISLHDSIYRLEIFQSLKIFKGKEKLKLDQFHARLHSFWLQKSSAHMYVVWLFHMASTAGAVGTQVPSA